MNFDQLLVRFSSAVERGDGDGLADLFTDDGVYDDYFFGTSGPGRAGIKKMLGHFYEGGTKYLWRFSDPAASGALGYASYVFSYNSTLPEAEGARVVFDGVSKFVLSSGRIQRYSEVFDRGMAPSQLNFAPDRLAKIMRKYAATTRELATIEPHLKSP